MQIRLLGPLEVVGPEGPQRVAGPKERAVLAVLALEGGGVVSDDRLVDSLWGEHPPPSALRSLRSYVSRLRRELEAAGAPGAIQTAAGGYRLELSSQATDVGRVEDLVAQAREAAGRGDHAWAAVALAEAARAWRGRPLGELADETWAITHATRLAELRLVVLEERVDAELACGRHAALVAELEALCGEYPLRERFWAQRMTALYRSGRQAEALRSYQELRRVLGEELGIEPSPALRSLERAVLAQDPALDWQPPPQAPSPLPAHAVGLPAGMVTLLLTDIEGSTALWESDPKAMAAALQRHDQLVGEVVGGAGGRVIKSKGEGDSTLSVFTRATDAAAAAIGLQRALLAEEWPSGLLLRVRMALHTGEPEQRDGDYYGRPVNRAARLRGVARGGQILCSRATADLIVDELPGDAVLVELGSHELKDLSRAEHVFALMDRDLREAIPGVIEVTSTRIPFPSALDASAGLRFVGRESERRQLDEALSAVRQSGRRTVLVTGEPGIGKTRLAAEAAHAAYQTGCTVLYGRCDEHVSAAYQPFAEALRHFVEHAPASVLRSHVDRHGPDLARLVPELARRVAGLSDPPQLEPETERLRLFEAVAGILASASADEPVVLVLDDLHWASLPTLLLLRQVVGGRDPARLLILATYRDTEVARSHPLAETLGDLRRAASPERLALAGLDTADVMTLLADEHQTDPGLAEAVRERTAGNPFFVQEITRHLGEVGGTEQDAGLPEGVRDVLGRRLSRLSAPANQALAVAAVVGAEFELRVLEAIPEAGDTVLDALDEAVAARLLMEVAGAPGSYRFGHSLTRETLYEELTIARRVRLHRRVGEAIEAVHGRSLDDHLPALALHFSRAAPEGQGAKAAAYCVRAARRALDRLAFEEASEFARSGLAVVELDADVDPVARCELLLVGADADTRQGEYPRAREAALEAAEVGRQSNRPDLLAEAAIAAAYAHPRGPRPSDPRVVAVCEEALEATAPDDARTQARVLSALSDAQAISRWGPSDDRSVSQEALEERARRAVAAARRADDPETLCAALTQLAWALVGTPRMPEQHAVCDELIEMSRAQGYLLHRAQGHYYRAMGRLVAGDIEGAGLDIEELAELVAETRLAMLEGYSASGRALMALLAGDFSQVERMTQDLAPHARRDSAFGAAQLGLVTQLARERGRTVDVVAAPWAVGHAVDEIEDWAEFIDQAMHASRDKAREAVTRMASNDFHFMPPGTAGWITGVAVTAEFAVASGWTEPEPALESALAPYSGLFAAGGLVCCYGAVDRYLGMLAARSGRYSEAETYFRRALDSEHRTGVALFTARTRYWYAWMLLRRGGAGDRELAADLLDECQRIACELGMAGLAEEASELQRELARPAGNLPLPVSTFVGRDTDVADLLSLVPTSHIVTLVGTGGVGKTRLALEVAAHLAAEYPDGAWLCELGNLSDPASVPEALAMALELAQVQGKPVVDVVLDYLRDKRLLLIVDNCEHLVGPVAGLLEALVRSCPRVRVLATSREALSVDGEVTWPVRSLESPPPGSVSAVDAIAKYEAIQLFLDRARATRPGFSLTVESAETVVEICRRLDGIPLAIELAAARVRSMSPAEIRDRLDERFRLLTAGRRTALERHQTLRAAVTWSYGLLTEEEKRVFRRLSVFAGTFDLPAAEAVSADDRVGRDDILDLLANLVAKSLVVAEEGTNGATRYRVLETLRQYGRERLDEAEEVAVTAQHHAQHYAEILVDVGQGLRGPGEPEWMDRFETEIDNVRAAAQWAVGAGDAELAVRLCAPIPIWSFFGGPVAIELASWARAIIELPEAAEIERFDQVCIWAGMGDWWRGEHFNPTHYARIGIDACKQRGRAPTPILVALLGLTVYAGASWDEVSSTFLAGAEAARSWPDDAERAAALATTAMAVAHLEVARSFAEEAVDIARRVGCPSVLATALCGLGQTLLDHEDEAAARAFDEARALDPRHRYWTTSLAEFNLADIRVRQGDRRALAAIAACLRLLQRTGNRGQLIGEIASAAGVLAILGEDEAAAVLSGVQLTGFNATPRDAARIDLARQRLGEGKFLAHAAVGTDWGEDEAVERVCRLLDSLAASATTDQPPEEGESDAAVDDAGHQ